MNHKSILQFIKCVRDSFNEAPIIYTHGACYQFHLILKQVFKSTEPYMTDDKQHVLSKINDKFYDINGEYVNVDGDMLESVIKLKPQHAEYWDNIHRNQTLKYMMSKYNKNL